MTKYFIITIILMTVSISGKAQFNKANGEFFEWGGRYNYTSSLNELYTLDVWGYEGEFEAILSFSGKSDNYKLNCAVEFLDIDGEVMWKTMYLRYMSVADGDFIYDIDFEDIAKTTGRYPILFILTMSENEIYTELLDLEIESVESEKTLKNIFIKEEESKTEKTTAEMIVGSWYEETATGFDISFFEDGSLFWHSGTDEAEADWKITVEGKLKMFGTDYEILELSETNLKVTDGETEALYIRVDE